MNKWKQYLHAANDNKELHRRFNLLVSHIREITPFGRTEASYLFEEIRKTGYTQHLKEVTQKMVNRKYNEPIPERTLSGRKRIARGNKRYRDDFEWFLEGINEETSTSDELIPVIHGGDYGRIMRFLQGGQGYRTENFMPIPGKRQFTHDGLMFHSRVTERAEFYALASAARISGVKAILIARVERKHLFHNQGDEYSMPCWNRHHLKDIVVITEFDKDFYHYGKFYEEYRKSPSLV